MANKWAVAVTVMLPTFMEIMDTSVVNVSLPHIQGSLNAGLDEVTWVLTSYLVSNAIIIPISGWLSGVFGRKRYLLFSVFLFVGSSILCGAATSLSLLVTARAIQGIGGGGLQPLSQAILLESFPEEEHGLAMAFFGMGVVLAPILGPVLGGWITDHWNWRWIFYINFPMGILAVILIVFLIQDPPYIRNRQRQRIDVWGLLLLTVGLGSLQIVLDKGQRDDWFQSRLHRLYDDHCRHIPSGVYRRGISDQKSGGESSGLSPSQFHFRVYHHVQRISGAVRNARAFAVVCSESDGL